MNPLSFVPGHDLARLATEARKYPILEAERERALFERWRDEGDRKALDELVGAHLRLVLKIARRNAGYGLPLTDLVSEGFVGLMQAVGKFDPDKGARFATYASWWIRATMHEYILHSWSLVKIGTTAAQKKLFFNLGRLKRELTQYEEGDLHPEVVATIAKTLDVREDEVVDMNRRMSSGDWSLNAPVTEDDGRGEFLDLLVDDTVDVERQVGDSDEFLKRRALMQEALTQLNDRERDIVEQRRLSESPQTLQDLGERYGISRERVRQIEARALEKLEEIVRLGTGRGRDPIDEGGADEPGSGRNTEKEAKEMRWRRKR